MVGDLDSARAKGESKYTPSMISKTNSDPQTRDHGRVGGQMSILMLDSG
jgi:hypothetical protein